MKWNKSVGKMFVKCFKNVYEKRKKMLLKCSKNVPTMFSKCANNAIKIPQWSRLCQPLWAALAYCIISHKV